MTITLRRMNPTGADRDALIEFLSSNDWPFHVGSRVDRVQAARAIDAGRYQDEDNDTWWIEEDEGRRIGFVRFEDLTSSPMLDLRVQASARGHGYGLTALSLATQHVFTTMPHVTRFEGTTRQDNVAMRKTFERAGWVKECHYRQSWPTADGQLLDAVGYVILRCDWESGTTTPVPWNDFPAS